MKKDETMKCIVETTGSFTLINTTSEPILNNRPCVTDQNNFIEVQLNKKNVKMLARHLPRKAKDDDFLDALNKAEGDVEVAVAAFCAEHGVTPDGDKIEADDLEGKAAEEAKKAEEEAARKAEEEAARKAEEEAAAKKAAEEEAARKAKEAEDAEVAKRVAEAEEANKKLEEEKNNDKNSESTTSETQKSDGPDKNDDAGKAEEKKKQGSKKKKGK